MSETKPIELVTGHRTKEEIENRKEQQEKLKGDNTKIEPTQKITSEQLEIFDSVKNEMKESGILNNLDSYWLTQFAIAADTLKILDEKSKKNTAIIFNKEFKSTKKLYFDIFTKCCSELSMSPIARAKIANINSKGKQKQEDPVTKALKGEY